MLKRLQFILQPLYSKTDNVTNYFIVLVITRLPLTTPLDLDVGVESFVPVFLRMDLTWAAALFLLQLHIIKKRFYHK